ncbi:MAG: esterase-like activity of phytase family protein [Duganella sp.]
MKAVIPAIPLLRRCGALALAIPVLLAAGCAQLPASPVTPSSLTPSSISSLRLIGEQRLPWRLSFQGTMVGGLSGIDYDAARGDWVMISDDRSEHQPARFYRARLDYDAQAFRSVQLTAVTTLLQADGTPYPAKDDFVRLGGVVPDLETVRVDPLDGAIWYASEGDVSLDLDPFVRKAGTDGRYLYQMPMPALFKADPRRQNGPRNNQAFEGMSFTPDGNSLWVSMEGPLYQDGAPPDPVHGAVNRITRFSRDGKVLGQYAYPLGPIAAVPGKGKHADNGISELLALSDTRALVMERSGVQDENGNYHDFVRIYEIDTTGATDVQHLRTLAGSNPASSASYTMLSKRLVLDLNKLPLPLIDNLEGMSFGPRLANGHASLVLISDDNFNQKQVTQLLLFEVLP